MESGWVGWALSNFFLDFLKLFYLCKAPYGAHDMPVYPAQAPIEYIVLPRLSSVATHLQHIKARFCFSKTLLAINRSLHVGILYLIAPFFTHYCYCMLYAGKMKLFWVWLSSWSGVFFHTAVQGIRNYLVQLYNKKLCRPYHKIVCVCATERMLLANYYCITSITLTVGGPNTFAIRNYLSFPILYKPVIFALWPTQC